MARRSFRRRSALLACCALVLSLLAVTSQAWGAPYENVPTPNLEGPIPETETSHIFMRTNVPLAKYGYTEEEYFLTGTGFTYNTTGAVNVTGTKITTGGPNENGTYPFKTRIVVRRPINPADFNGKVVAEWQNVTAQFDLEPEWDGNPYSMMKAGYVYVAVDAQNAGINGLKKYNAERYGSLEVGPTGDALSYDVWGAAIKAIRGDGTGPQPLGALTSKITNVTGSGASQSCGRLATYYNKVSPIHEIVDDFLVTDCTSAVRADRPEKVLRVIAEFENKNQQTEAEFPENPSLRHWEAAGGSHVPFMVGAQWEPLINRDVGPAESFCTHTPLFSTVNWPYAVDAGLGELIAWEQGGPPPPAAPRGEYVNPTTLKRNSLGIALGGLRLPEVEVPAVVDLAENSAHAAPNPFPFSAFCQLQGQHQPISEETLNSMYPNIAAYVADVKADAEKLESEGFLIPEGVERIVDQAEEFPRLRPTTPAVSGSPSSNSFGLGWVGPAPSHPGNLVPKFVEAHTTFEVQRRSALGGEWTTVASSLGEPSLALSGEETGIWDYRVRSTTVEPAHQLEPEMTFVSPWSEQVQVAVGFTAISGNVKGKLTVKAGEAVQLTSSAKVSGAITVRPGGSLDVEGATLSGSVSTQGATIVRICGAQVGGPVKILQNTGPVMLGGNSDGCSPNTFHGTVTVKESTGGVVLEGNTIASTVKVLNNSPSTSVVNNTIASSLTVTGNTGSVTDSPNEVEGKSKLQ
jgi:hypothetical protein